MKQSMLKKYGISCFLLVLGIYLTLGLNKTLCWSYTSRLIWTTHALSQAQRQIEKFQEAMGRYPLSLYEINQYAKNNQKAGFRIKPFREHLSHSKGNANEYHVLNGKQGWYYDPNTGEVKVNLTKPVKHYMWFYFGKERNEIPANW